MFHVFLPLIFLIKLFTLSRFSALEFYLFAFNLSLLHIFEIKYFSVNNIHLENFLQLRTKCKRILVMFELLKWEIYLT